MRFACWPRASQPWNELLDLATHAERTGWDGIYVADHFMPPDDLSGHTHECFALLAGLAAAVPRLRLGTLVAGNTYRYPAVLAKQAATIDHISGGRVLLGLGAGWQENEHVAYGIPFPSVTERLDRLEEACAVLTSLWREPRSSFDGTYYALVDAPLEPKPVQAHLPLLVGGGGEKRTMRIAARYADEWNVWGMPDLLRAKGEVLEQHCAALGRDPAEIRRSTQALVFLGEDEGWLAPHRQRDYGRATVVGTPDEMVEIMAAYRDAGVDEFIVPDFTMRDPARRADTYDLFIERVAPHLR